MFFGSEPNIENWTVPSTGQSGTGNFTLKAGGDVCSIGSYAVSWDRQADVTFAIGRRAAFAADNPFISQPEFFPFRNERPHTSDTVGEGEVRTYDYYFNTWTVQRLTDTDNKEFRVTFHGEHPAEGAAAAPSADAGRQASGDEPVTAIKRGVNVCVTNDSTHNVKVNWLIQDTKTGDGSLAPMTSFCAEGTFTWTDDVKVNLTFADNLDITLGFANPPVGQPGVTRDAGKQMASEMCGAGDVDPADWATMGFCTDSYAEGDTNTYTVDGFWHAVVVTRQPDNDWKQFTVSIREP